MSNKLNPDFIRRLNLKSVISMSFVIIILILAFIAAAFGLRKTNEQYVEESYPLLYEADVKKASEKYGVDMALIYGIIKTESNFDTNAVSSAGAIGLMQIMPETFEWIQTYYVEEDNYTVDDLKDYHVSIDYGTHLLAILIDMYGIEDTAICAYNAGVGNVDSWLSDERYSKNGKTLYEIPIQETKNYLRLVRQNKSIYNRLYFENNSLAEEN